MRIERLTVALLASLLSATAACSGAGPDGTWPAPEGQGQAATAASSVAELEALDNTTGEGTGRPLVDSPPAAAQGKVRRPVVGTSTFGAWGFGGAPVADYADGELDAIPQGAAFPQAPRLLEAAGESVVYVIDGGFKRHVVDTTSFASWQFDAAEVQQISAGQLALVPPGPEWPARPILVKGAGSEVDVLDLPEAADAGTAVPGQATGSGGGAETATDDPSAPGQASGGSAPTLADTPPTSAGETERPPGCAVGGRGSPSGALALAPLATALLILGRRRRRPTSV